MQVAGVLASFEEDMERFDGPPHTGFQHLLEACVCLCEILSLQDGNDESFEGTLCWMQAGGLKSCKPLPFSPHDARGAAHASSS